MQLITIPRILACSILLIAAANLYAQEEAAVQSGSQEAQAADDSALLEAFELYKQHRKSGALDETESLAKRVIEIAIRTKGPRSSEAASALTNLAIVQHQTGQFGPAQQNFQAAVEIIEEIEDRLNSKLVNPLKGLAAAQLEAGRPDLASSTYDRAVHVTHVNDGPHNLGQLPLLESLSEAKLRMGELDLATTVQDRISALNARHYDFQSLEFVPSLMRRAAWQHRAGLIYDSRTTYRRAIRLIESQVGKSDVRLINPLLLLGRSFFFIDFSGTSTYRAPTMVSGELYIKRAVRIANKHSDSDWKTLVVAKLALGDFYMYDRNSQRARAVYREIWNLLSEDDARLDFRQEQLEEVVILRQRNLPQYLPDSNADGKAATDSTVLQGTVSMTYDVSTHGRAFNIKLVEANPPEFQEMQKLVQREIRRRIFRPRFENAEAVVSTSQLLIHSYFYRQSDLDALRGPAKKTAKN